MQFALWSITIGACAALLASLGARTSKQARTAIVVGLLVSAYFGISLALGTLQVRLVGPGHYPWLPKLIVGLLVLRFASMGVGPSRDHVGLGRPRWDATSPYVIVAMIACVIVSFADPSIPGDPRNPECIAFEASMPGLDEELFFRGVLLALLNDAWPRKWSLFGAPIGWGYAVNTALFLFGHLFSVDGALHFRVATALLPAASLLGFGLCCTWIRERSGNVWWSVLAHNVANSSLVAVGWFH